MPSRFPQGKVNDTPVGGVDLVPTFFSMAGIELPWEMHGRDLTPLLEKPETKWDRSLLMVHTGKYYGSDTKVIPTDPAILKDTAGVPWYASIHDGRYKYIRTFVEGEIEELYDLESDPEELTNLAQEKSQAARVAKMRADTIAELKRTDAGFADALPSVATANEK